MKPKYNRLFAATTLLLLLCTPAARCHKLGQSLVYLQVYEDAIEGRFEINFLDLDKIIKFSDGVLEEKTTLKNLNNRYPDIKNYLTERVNFSQNGVRIPFRLTGYDTYAFKTTHFITIDFVMDHSGQRPDVLDIYYDVGFKELSGHTGLILIEYNWNTATFAEESNIVLTFDRAGMTQSLDLTESSTMTGFLAVVRLGIWHIWIGLDHILFLIALILPSVVVRGEKGWEPVTKFRPALIYVVKIVTLFTVAHSITLSVAALGVIQLPSRLVESVIAASIAVAAVDIIYPVFNKRIWFVVFGFGLFHGFGFASVLGDLGVLREYMILSLFGFNLGVEVGQVAIICVVFPFLYLLRTSKFYRKGVLKPFAVALILVAGLWFFERAFEFNISLVKIFQRIFS